MVLSAHMCRHSRTGHKDKRAPGKWRTSQSQLTCTVTHPHAGWHRLPGPGTLICRGRGRATGFAVPGPVCRRQCGSRPDLPRVARRRPSTQTSPANFQAESPSGRAPRIRPCSCRSLAHAAQAHESRTTRFTHPQLHDRPAPGDSQTPSTSAPSSLALAPYTPLTPSNFQPESRPSSRDGPACPSPCIPAAIHHEPTLPGPAASTLSA